jgi:Xaa-Pro aminopeptidase
MTSLHPTLSLKERDRRWKNVREMMKANRLDCIIVPGLRGREQLEGYLSNDAVQGIVVFPLEGPPTYLARNTRIIRNMENSLRGIPAWIGDIRDGASGPALAGVLREKGFDSARIGVVGLESGEAGESEGYMPFKIWSHVLKELPRAIFIEVSRLFAGVVLVKGEEERALVKHGASIGEKACEAMLNVIKPGVSEPEICAAILSTIFRHGASAPNMILHSGVDNPSWGEPIWFYQAQQPRLLQRGDVVQTEIFPRYGGIETQQQMTVALKPVHPVNQELAAIARRSYEVALKVLRPGKTFGEVCEAMGKPIADAGCWHLTPLIHSLAPIRWVSQLMVGIENLPGNERYGMKSMPVMGGDLVIKPGMVFELEPNACRGKHRINIGGTVLVTETGLEELNHLATEMRVVD